MEHTPKTTRESGFTLVELAIVMIIIGLLIGGILKGQELISNAQVAATVTRVKNIETAANTFRDSFAAMPGDMRNAAGTAGRLDNCATGTVCAPGNGNGRIDDDINAAMAVDERVAFWAHLAAADLFAATDPSLNPAAATDHIFGETHPTADVGGGFIMGYSTGVVGTNAGELIAAAGDGRPGHYLALSNAAAPAGSTTGIINATIAERIDRKMDNGVPSAGSVIAFGTGGSTTPASTDCFAGTDYNITGGAGCGLYFRVQQ